MSEPEWSLGDMNIPLKGRESLFERNISDRVFRGTSYMLELSGDRTVSYGTPATVNITGSLTLETWIWLEALPTAANSSYWGWVTGTGSPWKIRISSTGTVSISATFSTVDETITSTFSLATLRFYHLAVVVNGRDVTFYLWNDDTQTLTTDIHVNAFSSATRDTRNGDYRLRSNTDATFKPWWDESRVWNVARTLSEIAADRFRPLATNIPATCVHRVGFDDGTGTTVTDSSASAAHGTISGAGTSTWLWAHEGGPELAGVSKIDVWGERWGVAPIVVDPFRNGYAVAGGGSINDLTTYEGGAPHTMDASAASFRAYITTTPLAIHSLRYLPRGLFKLGAQPVLPISALVKGYNGGALGYVNQGGTITRDIITRRGPKIIDPTEIDTASFTTYNALSTSTGICGIAIYNKEPINGIVDFLVNSGSGWWGYKRASTLFHIERYSGPAVSADFNFTQKKIISITPMPPQAVVHEVIVRYRKNNVIHSEEQVAASVKGTANWTQWTMAWQEQPASDESLKSATSISIIVETALQYQADARILADFLLALLKGKKQGWNVTVISTGLEATMGQTATIGVTMQNELVRYGLDGGDMYSIVTVGDQWQQVRLELWGSV